MKKTHLLLLLVVLHTTPLFSQRTISGKTQQKSISLAVADYSNGIPMLSAKAEFIEPSGNNLLDAEEVAQIKITITNSGTNSAFDVGVDVKIDNGSNLSFRPTKNLFNEIRPNKTVTSIVNITANSQIKNTTRRFDIKFTEHQGFIAKPISYTIQTQKFREPHLVFVECGIEELGGNQNNIIEQGELILVSALIQNKGQGTAVASRYTFSGFSNALISTMEKKYPVSGNLGDLAPGESKIIKFAFSPTWNYTDTDIPLKIKLSESRNMYGGNYDLGLEMRAQQIAAVDMKTTGQYQEQVEIADASLTSAIDKNIPKNKAQNNRFALIIGNEHYKSNDGLAVDVPFAINDAITFKKYATQTLGVPENQVIMLTDARVTKMENEIENFVSLMSINGENREFYIYYAGHGFHDDDKNSYLMPVNVKHNDVGDAIKLADFYEQLSQHPTKKTTVFLDACFSGGGRDSDGLIPGRTGFRTVPKKTAVSGNIVVFAASQGDQTSKPYNQEKHGLFTYFLLKKIQETKGNINYNDLASYLEQNVSTQSRLIFKEEQTPKIKISPTIKDKWKTWTF